jgi:cytochrome c oxidase cbb3-type subunit 2
MKHEAFEKNSLLLLIGILVVVSIGGIVQIAPLFWVESTIEKVKGMRPYTPLEQAGRDIYIREGCYGCHSQMVRTLRDEVERYGHYSLAAESMYDHPFQWGSKRTGPDLARVGGKYSDQWQAEHLINPRAVVPESIMPGYPWLADTKLDMGDVVARLKTLRLIGVPYSDEMTAGRRASCCAATPRPKSQSSTAGRAMRQANSTPSSPTCRFWARSSISRASTLPVRTRGKSGTMTYETIATISQVTSLLMFIAMFAGVLVYALWPRNGPRFEAAQRRALDLGRKPGSDSGGTGQ